MAFHEYDVVKLKAGLPTERVDPTIGAELPPKVGDLGTVLIVHAAKPGCEPGYLVECVGSDGSSRWLADVYESELELVHPGGAGVA